MVSRRYMHRDKRTPEYDHDVPKGRYNGFFQERSSILISSQGT